MEHLTDTAINQYRSGTLEDAADYARVEQHLRACADCEARLRRGTAPASATLLRALYAHTHPEDDLLLRYARNAADAPVGVADHIDHCSRCQEDVAHLRAYLLAQTATRESRQSEPDQAQAQHKRNERPVHRFPRRAFVFGLVPAMAILLLFVVYRTLMNGKRPSDLTNTTTGSGLMSPDKPSSAQIEPLSLIQPIGQIQDTKPKFRWQRFPGSIYVVTLTDAHYTPIQQDFVKGVEQWDCPKTLLSGEYTWEVAAFASVQSAKAYMQGDSVNGAASKGRHSQSHPNAVGQERFTILNSGKR